jgi:capsular exopolysaccharide synthesis family protein
LKALRRRWLAAALLGVLAAAVVGPAVWYFLPPGKYTAVAKLRMESKPTGTLFEHPEGKADFTTFQQTQVGVIKGQLVLNTALRDPKVAALKDVREQADPVSWLEKEVRVEFPNGPEIARVSISSDDPEACKALADAVVNAYLQEVTNQEKKERKNRLKELEDICKKYDDRVKSLRAAARAKAEAVGSNDNQVLALKQQMFQASAKKAKDQLLDEQTLLRELVNKAKLLKERDPAKVDIPKTALDQLVDRDREVAPLITKQAGLEELIANMIPGAVGHENNPEVRKQIDKLEGVKKDLEAKRAAVRPTFEAQLRERILADAQVKEAQLAEDVKEKQGLCKQLEQDIEEYQKQAQQISVAALDLEDRKRDIAEAEVVATKSAQDKEKLEVEQFDPPRVSLWEEASVSRPDEAVRKLQAGVGAAAAALVLMLLAVAFLEFRARRVVSAEDVSQGLGLKLVGTVPARPGGRRAALDPEWQSLLAESVDSTRALLVHAAQASGVRVVMITSAVGGEGKTSLASHLAVSLARGGRKTLLLDADLRNPAAHVLFERPLGPGLGELLRGEAEVADAVQATNVPGLHLVAAGRCDRATPPLLGRDGPARLFARLKEQFDFVIVDSSPVLPVADPLLLAQHVDGVLFSVMRNVSTLPTVHQAHQRLATLDVLLLGAVVSAVREEAARYGRRHYAQPAGA